MSDDTVDLTPDDDAAISRLLAQAPALTMPHAVWERLQAALVVEAANRNHADQLTGASGAVTPQKAGMDVAETIVPELTAAQERRLADEFAYGDDE